MKVAKLKLRRTSNRQFEKSGGGKKVIRPAEYAVFRGTLFLASIIKNGDGWRACVPSKSSKIGNAISPVGMDKFKAVRDWSYEHFAEKEN